MKRGQFARNVDLGSLEIGKRILDLNRHWLGRIAEGAELFAFGEDFASS